MVEFVHRCHATQVPWLSDESFHAVAPALGIKNGFRTCFRLSAVAGIRPAIRTINTELARSVLIIRQCP